jgi:NADPH2:quinone reductase
MSQAVVVREHGGSEVLRVEEHDPGEPGAGSVRIRVSASGVNFIDVYMRSGLYPRPTPFVLGLEGAGVVEATGPGVEDLVEGDRVAWASVPGSYAEALIAPAARLVAIPEGISDPVAAAAMLQGMTAHYLVQGVRSTAPGDTALVHAGAGGVGLLLIQTLKAAQARVMGTCSTQEKEDLARQAGADQVVRYTERDFASAAREWTGGRGVDVVYDSVGRSTFEGSMKSLRPRGLLCLYGQSSGVVPPFDLNQLNAMGSLFVTRPSLAHYTASRAELLERADAVLGAIAGGCLRVRIGAQFPLAQARAAHDALEGRLTTGKVLLLPRR